MRRFFRRLRRRRQKRRLAIATQPSWTQLSRKTEVLSLSRLHLLGYLFLIFSVVEFANILYPPNLANANWEFQAMEGIVDRTWGVLFGLILVFLNRARKIRVRTRQWLSALSWLVLLMGLIYLLLLPLGVVNTKRLYDRDLRNYQAQRAAQAQRLEAVETRLSENTLSPVQLQRLAAALNLPVEGDRPLPDRIRSRLEQQLAQLDRAYQTQRREFLKRGLKLNLSALLFGFAFLWLWWLARDYRRSDV